MAATYVHDMPSMRRSGVDSNGRASTLAWPADLGGLAQECLDDEPMKRSDERQVQATRKIVAMNDRRKDDARPGCGIARLAIQDRRRVGDARRQGGLGLRG